MIFRRIKAHIEKENWFAVFIDFIIVVFGVFMGFQVNNWNEGRKLQAQEQSYLVRLFDDMNDSVASFEQEKKYPLVGKKETKSS